MITITVKRASARTRPVQEVSICGHSCYEDYGKDIVCAAVSSVSINTINATEALLGVSLETQQSDGELVCRVPELPNSETAEQVQLLMETLVFSLESIAEEYPSFVSVTVIT